MRAIVIDRPDKRGGNITIRSVPEPEPGLGELLVDVAYCGCNFADTMLRQGTYPHPRSYPLVAGLEVSGTVAGLGAGVAGFALGDRVVGVAEIGGGFAERCVLSAERVARLPEAIGFDVAAAFHVQALTAWHLLHTASTIRAGELVLIHAIGGGVGLYLTQLAVRAGATVIGTVGTAGKAERALDFGATLVVDRNEQDFVATIGERFGEGAIDKIYDSTGASILDRSFSLMRPLGHVISYGEAEGPPLPNLWERLVERSLTFTRFHLGHLDFGASTWARSLTELSAAVMSGELTVPIERVFAFEEADEMYQLLESRRVAGKLLLAVQPSAADGRQPIGHDNS